MEQQGRRLSIYQLSLIENIPPISTKEALARWEEQTGESASNAKIIMLNGYYPPIDRMDSSLGRLQKCEKLSLSTNMIEKISFLHGLQNLKILSLGRNLITNLLPLEVLNDTLEELWISYNAIQKFDGILHMKKLRVLYISHNQIKDWTEFRRLASINSLEDLSFYGNPLHDEWKNNDEGWIDAVQKILRKLIKLDGYILKRDIDIDF